MEYGAELFPHVNCYCLSPLNFHVFCLSSLEKTNVGKLGVIIGTLSPGCLSLLAFFFHLLTILYSLLLAEVALTLSNNLSTEEPHTKTKGFIVVIRYR